MTHFQTILSLLAECNMHFCVYGAFGTILFLRAALDWRACHYGEAREHAAHGLVYLGLGLV